MLFHSVESVASILVSHFGFQTHPRDGNKVIVEWHISHCVVSPRRVSGSSHLVPRMGFQTETTWWNKMLVERCIPHGVVSQRHFSPGFVHGFSNPTAFVEQDGSWMTNTPQCCFTEFRMRHFRPTFQVCVFKHYYLSETRYSMNDAFPKVSFVWVD